MIRSFRCKETEVLYHRHHSRRFAQLENVARRKLRMLDDADRLEDVAAVPGNRFEALERDRRGQYSIRVNDQWRICFRWREGAAEDVEIVDYH
ncbi:MAG: type II toxin-antitoxin system RelE/ParE family toxin [Acidobacteria bacterium]|nr:type II toxin-antitoxin system RelE/ParE family toxin [Acidobacteriota bacterium]